MDGPGRGVMLSTFDSLSAGIPPVARSAARAEALGLDSVWVGDHLFFHRPNIEALVALAAAAGATSRIGLGTGVLLPALRDPVVLGAFDVYGFLPRVHAEADYPKPMQFDDELEVAAEIVHLGRTSVEIAFHVERDGEVVGRGGAVAVWVDADGSPQPLAERMEKR